MKTPKFIKPLTGILCVLSLVLVVFVALYLDSLSPDPIFGVFRPTAFKRRTAAQKPY